MGSYTKMLSDLANLQSPDPDTHYSNSDSVGFPHSTSTQNPLNSLKTQGYQSNILSSASPLGAQPHLSSPALGLKIPGFSQKNQNDKSIADELKKLFGAAIGNADMNRITD